MLLGNVIAPAIRSGRRRHQSMALRPVSMDDLIKSLPPENRLGAVLFVLICRIAAARLACEADSTLIGKDRRAVNGKFG
jgi:hypothetical protein